MARHIFIYQLKSLIRRRSLLFWNFMFPIILGTLFNLAFQNLDKDEIFQDIPIVVLYEDNTDPYFEQVMASVSETKMGEGDSGKLFLLLDATNEEDAKEMLQDNVIKGYIKSGESQSLVIKGSGYEETILKSFLDSYKQHSAIVADIMMNTQGTANVDDILSILQADQYISGNDMSEASIVIIPFYSLLAMACIYSSMLGIGLVEDIQANQSAFAARNAIAPVPKMLLVLANVLARVIVQFLLNVIILGYIYYVIKIPLRGGMAYLLGITFTGVIVGILIGVLVGLLVKGKKDVKMSTCVGVTMIGCFLSGMMIFNMKYWVQEKVPMLAKINPVNVISDAYYSLYYYDTHERFWENMIILFIMIVVMTIGSIMLLRRQQYDNI